MIAEPLRRYLDGRRAHYRVHPHARGATAAEIAEITQVSGSRLARTALVLALTQPPGQLVLVAVPAQTDIDLPRLHSLLGFPVERAHESACASAFPGCAPGSLPPIGEIAVQHVPVYVDTSLSLGDTIAFSGGSDTDLVEMPWSEYRRVAAHTLVHCCRPLDPPPRRERDRRA